MRTTSKTRAGVMLLLAAAAVLWQAAAADAHVVMSPAKAIGGTTVTYKLVSYPHTGSQLIGFTATIPAPLDVQSASAGDGLTPKLIRNGGRVTSIVWSGHATTRVQQVSFVAKTGLAQARVIVPTVQAFADGTTAKWDTARTTVLGYTDYRPKRHHRPVDHGSSTPALWMILGGAIVVAAAIGFALRHRLSR